MLYDCPQQKKLGEEGVFGVTSSAVAAMCGGVLLLWRNS